MTIPYSVRPLEDDDIPDYHALRLEGLVLHPEAFGESAAAFRLFTVKRLRERLDAGARSGGFVLGAFINRSLVGTIGLAISDGEKQRHRATLWGMYVHPPFRTLGVARRLVETLVQRASDNPSVEQIHLSVNTNNEAAKKLYESMGFSVYGREPRALRVDGQYYDEDLMVRMMCRG